MNELETKLIGLLLEAPTYEDKIAIVKVLLKIQGDKAE